MPTRILLVSLAAACKHQLAAEGAAYIRCCDGAALLLPAVDNCLASCQKTGTICLRAALWTAEKQLHAMPIAHGNPSRFRTCGVVVSEHWPRSAGFGRLVVCYGAAAGCHGKLYSPQK